jgi:Tfp pilus assembly protein PilN
MIRINLLGRVRPKVKRRVAIGGALQVFMLLAALALPVAWMVVRYSLIQSEISRLNEEIRQKESEKRQMAQLEREIAEFENKRRLLEGRIAVIETLKRNQSGPVKMLDTVGDTVSMVDTLWLTSMEEKAGGEIEFKGQANTVNAVADFIMRLNQSGYFRSVELKESVQKAQQEGTVNFEFTLTAVFSLPPPPAAEGAGAPAAGTAPAGSS